MRKLMILFVLCPFFGKTQDDIPEASIDISMPKLEIGIGAQYKGGGIFDAALNIPTFKTKRGSFDAGIGFTNRTSMLNLPINNENKDIRFSPNYIILKNRYYFLNRFNPKYKRIVFFGEFNAGLALNKKNTSPGTFNMHKGYIFEGGAGFTFVTKWETKRGKIRYPVYSLGVSLSNHVYKGLYIPNQEERNLHYVKIDLSTIGYNIKITRHFGASSKN